MMSCSEISSRNFLNRSWVMHFALLLHHSQHPTVWNADVMVGTLHTILNNEDKTTPRYGRAMSWIEPESPFQLF